MKYQDWQRDSRDDHLSADSDDAPLSVQTWLHQRQRTGANPLRHFANVFGVLAVFAFSFYLLAEYSGFGELLKAKTNGLLTPPLHPLPCHHSSSVCLNHRRGSIDYRECRKAAKVHFREQCRAWEKRWERDRQDWSKQMEQRYCSAANGFSPMG